MNYIAHFLKPGGLIGIAGAGLVRELDGNVPEHLKEMWTQDFWAIHSASWWRKHWERTGIVDFENSETMTDGWLAWRDWLVTAHPENTSELEAVEADGGQYLAYFRMVARRRADAKLEDYCWPDTMRSFPLDYERMPLLRS